MTVLVPLLGHDFPELKTLLEAIEFFGDVKQQTVAIEEMSELTQQICKFNINRPNKNRMKLVEEFGDVLIMLCQLEIIFGITPEEVALVQQFKLEKLKQLMEE